MHTRCLETREMAVAHNAENIAEELDQEMKEWNIRSKVVAATTDNGQNVIKCYGKTGAAELTMCWAHSSTGY